MKWFDITLVLVVVVALVACRQDSARSSAASTHPQTDLQTFAVQGEIRSLDADGKTVTIKHEEIPGYMPAMTMPFTAKDPNELAGVHPGDRVSFRMSVTADESWIDQLRNLGSAQTNRTNERPTRPPVRLVRDVEPLDVGDVLPDYRFTNELGQAIRLGEFRGKALALTFIFTRCPMPEFCPLMSRRFAEAYQKLTTTPDAPPNWHLLSISFDPHFDTPAVLKNYAQAYKHDPARWNFVTGAMIDIDAITEQFDLPIVKQGENWDHKLRTVVVDAAGRVQKIFVFNQWTVEDLVAEIVRAAHVESKAASPEREQK